MNPDHYPERDPREAAKEEWDKALAGTWARPEPQQFALYRCGWVEAGETKFSLAGQRWRAEKVMRDRLSEGHAAWIEELPFTDDDVPF